MATYLLTWNPEKFDWIDLPEDAAATLSSAKLPSRWSCGVTKKIQPGDRFFLLKQGKESPRGIMGSGTILSEPEPDEHWDEPGKSARYVAIEFDVLLDPGQHKILAREDLDDPGLSHVHWNTQSSGIEIEPEAAAYLESLWRDHLRDTGILVDAADGLDRLMAGGTARVIERLLPDRALRERVLSVYATAIEAAHERGPDKWSITLHPDRVRLIVGKLVICTIGRYGIWLALDPAALSITKRAQLSQSPEWRWDDKGREPVYSRPAAIAGYYLPDDESEIWSIIIAALRSMIGNTTSAFQQLHGQSRSSYSPGTLDYLSQSLGRTLPTPSWVVSND